MAVPLQSLGVFILWFGWYGFNAGSVRDVYGAATSVRIVATNMTLAAAAGAVVSFLWNNYFVATIRTIRERHAPSRMGSAATFEDGGSIKGFSQRTKNIQDMHKLTQNFGALDGESMLFGEEPTQSLDMIEILNGILAGLVAITGPCAVVTAWGAIVIGTVAFFVYASVKALLRRFFPSYDDPLDAFAVHGMAGAVGVIAPGLLAKKSHMELLFGGGPKSVVHYYGLFMGGGIRQLGVQIIGGLAIAGWALFWAVLAFSVLYRFRILKESDARLTVRTRLRSFVGLEAKPVGTPRSHDSNFIDSLDGEFDSDD